MTQLSQGVRELFEGKNFAHLATLMPDGSPQSTVVWVDVEGDNVLVNTSEGRVKPNNVRRDKRVAISVFDQENPYKSASVQGEVAEVRKDGATDHIHKLAKKYMDADEYPYLQPGEQRLIFVIRPDKVATMGVD